MMFYFELDLLTIPNNRKYVLGISLSFNFLITSYLKSTNKSILIIIGILIIKRKKRIFTLPPFINTYFMLKLYIGIYKC